MTETLYQGEAATVICGDAQDVLPGLARDSIDLLATDPPYGVDFRSNRGANFDHITGDDGSLDVPGVLAMCLPALRPFRHAYVFGYAADQITGALSLSATADLVWDKSSLGMGNLELPFAPSHERLTFGVHVRSEANKKRGDGRLSARMRQGSVLRVPRPNATAVKRHPTEKPVALMRQLVESSSLVGELVLDPFAGCGSTGVAAVVAGRRALLIEIDPKYAAIAVERVMAAESLARKIADL